MGIKEIKILVNTNLHNKNIGIKCETDTSLTLADFIRVVESLKDKHVEALKDYMSLNPDADIEKITFNHLKEND